MSFGAASGLTMDEVQRIAELDAEVVRGIFAGTENFKLRDLAAIIDALGTTSTFELTPASAMSAHQRIEKQRRIEEIKRAIRRRTPE
jgi:dihydroxyacetone kinase